MARTALAPRAAATSTSRCMASSRVSCSCLVRPLSSPPTRDLKPAPIWVPMLRDRTVRPVHSPSTRSTRQPGTSFMVETSSDMSSPVPA